AARRFAMSNAPLMPKATAVWLVDNTALTFDQVADFTKMHPLEVRAIADGDAAQGIKGMDPISTGQLTRDEIEKGEKDPNYRLKLGESKVALPPQAKKKGPRYTPVSRGQGEAGRRRLRRRHPAAGVRDHPERTGIRAEREAARRPQRRRRVCEAEEHRREKGGGGVRSRIDALRRSHNGRHAPPPGLAF